MQTFRLKVIGEIALRHLPQLINKEGNPPSFFSSFLLKQDLNYITLVDLELEAEARLILNFH